jgi:hypothetical protein
MTLREWLAWKLHRLAFILYDGEHREFISILRPDGKTGLSMVVVGDEYQFGIDSWEENMPKDWLVEVWN